MKTLFAPPPADGNLTEAQTFVLGLHRMNEDSHSMSAEDAGRFLHVRRRKHTLGVQCEWCESNGRAVLVALRKRGLVVRRRSGVWEALDRAPAYDPATAEIPY